MDVHRVTEFNIQMVRSNIVLITSWRNICIMHKEEREEYKKNAGHFDCEDIYVT